MYVQIVSLVFSFFVYVLNKSKKLSVNRIVQQRFCITANGNLHHSANGTIVSVYNFNWLYNTVIRILID